MKKLRVPANSFGKLEELRTELQKLSLIAYTFEQALTAIAEPYWIEGEKQSGPYKGMTVQEIATKALKDAEE